MIPFLSGYGNSAETITLIDHWLFQVILNGFYSVDSFFLLSGFLVSYVIFKMFAKSNEDKVQFPWLSFYIHRYIRLTPVYMIVLGFYTTLMAYLGSGPLWNLKDDPKCIANWWWNALYINNFQSAADQCMGWAWYLANDMQFYVISPLFLITLWWVPKIGFSLLAFAFIANFSSIFALTYVYNLIPGFGNIAEQVQNLTVFLDRWTNKFNKVYVRPYTRIGPYLVGIALAYIIIKRKEKNSLKLSLVS
ncbi:nose resistant to fluoxetine protein 6 [Nephila pilipes]|uniref:Nose resistant to fluoxetine protein 6 n=1 Tax=Nephila pilipes TaxID=299642 RepID=A0A8X6P231_NEPPI|nr:nose resistant to fluoxetine protein 6 [Nephila pilipes]GFU03479.1 nose resistant to fluoxetine protein 6 [Nephila pilipes]